MEVAGTPATGFPACLVAEENQDVLLLTGWLVRAGILPVLPRLEGENRTAYAGRVMAVHEANDPAFSLSLVSSELFDEEDAVTYLGVEYRERTEHIHQPQWGRALRRLHPHLSGSLLYWLNVASFERFPIYTALNAVSFAQQYHWEIGLHNGSVTDNGDFWRYVNNELFRDKVRALNFSQWNSRLEVTQDELLTTAQDKAFNPYELKRHIGACEYRVLTDPKLLLTLEQLCEYAEANKARLPGFAALIDALEDLSTCYWTETEEEYKDRLSLYESECYGTDIAFTFSLGRPNAAGTTIEEELYEEQDTFMNSSDNDLEPVHSLVIDGQASAYHAAEELTELERALRLTQAIRQQLQAGPYRRVL